MNNKIVIAIIAILVLIGVVYFATQKKDSSEETKSNAQTTELKDENKSEQGSMKSLLASGANKSCTFSYNENGASSTGTMYVTSGKMRGDFTSTGNTGTTVASHMVVSGSTNYTWVDGQSTGFKMSFDANAQPNSQNQSVDPNKNYDFSCKNWSPDNSKFELPSNITFQDLGSLTLPSAPSSGANPNASIQAGICASLSGEAKAQCEAAIKR